MSRQVWVAQWDDQTTTLHDAETYDFKRIVDEVQGPGEWELINDIDYTGEDYSPEYSEDYFYIDDYVSITKSVLYE